MKSQEKPFLQKNLEQTVIHSLSGFHGKMSRITFGEMLGAMGHVPIPPYLGRNDEESDAVNYQTVYARIDGSVAAPTAGLHFTPAVFNALTEKGIGQDEITLHVSAGTFRPVKSEMISDHLMHTEHFLCFTQGPFARPPGKKHHSCGNYYRSDP